MKTCKNVEYEMYYSWFCILNTCTPAWVLKALVKQRWVRLPCLMRWEKRHPVPSPWISGRSLEIRPRSHRTAGPPPPGSPPSQTRPHTETSSFFWLRNWNYRILHALWYIRVSDVIPVLELKGFFRLFEYSWLLHPPLRPSIKYWDTLIISNFLVLNTLPILRFSQ